MASINYRVLTMVELISVAERDARYLTDPLFAELVARLAGEPRNAPVPKGFEVVRSYAPVPLHIDARR